MADKRISGRRGQTLNLDVSFYRNGVLTDPYAIRKIEIYQTSVAPHNLITTIPFVDPDDSLYPSPAVKEDTGLYYYPYDVPSDAEVPDVYFDLWYYYADNPCDGSGTGTSGTEGDCDLDDDTLEESLLFCCHRFWVYPDGWACLDDLSVIEFGFEPLSIHFNKPETRPLQVGIMPLPLYDYDYNTVAPIIPMLTATISVETRCGELLVDESDMTIGLRQGSYRTNPYVLRWNLDTTSFLCGTYRYKVKVVLPDGTSRVSKWFHFTVS